MDVAPDKKTLRAYVRALKALLSTSQRQAEERAVWHAVEAMPAFAAARHILLYHSLPDELSTHKLFLRWSSMGKQLYLPVVQADTLVVRAFDAQAMQRGAYGIQEPQGNDVDLSTIDLIIVPGVAFDAIGNRLGRGKGYYDRLLSRARVTKVGVCYNCQLLPRVPAFAHDHRMDYVVTPARIYP